MSRTTERSRSFSVRPSRRDEDAAVGQGAHPLRQSLTRIAVPTALAALGAGTYVTAVTPRYTGQATIIVEGRDGGFSRPATNRVQAALTHDLAREAALRLKLIGNPEFDPAVAGIGPFQQATILLGIGENPLDQPAEDRVVESYLDHLLVSPTGNARVATLEFRAEDAQLAADGANLAAQLAVSAIVASDGQGEPGAASAQDIARLRRQVAEAQAKVEAYRARNGVAASAGQALSTPQLADLSNQLSMARLQRADLASRITAIKDLLKDGRAFETADIANTDSLRRMIDNRIAVKAQLAFESRTLLPAHPRIKGLKAQLEDLDGQINTSAERALRTMENDVMGADARIASLQAAVDGQRRMGNKDALVGGELAGLEREAAIQRDLLDAALGRLTAAPAQVAPSARIVAQAVRPGTPSFPAKLPIVGFTTLGAFLLSLGGVLAGFLRTAPRRKVAPVIARDMPTEERAPAAPRIDNPFTLPEAVAPDQWPGSESIRMETEIGLSTAEGAALSGAFDLEPLLGRLSRRADPGAGQTGRKIVVVDGGMSASGDLHAALASALLRSGSVVMVDLGGATGDDHRTGFTDVIAGSADFASVIQADGPGGAHHVAAGLTETETMFDEPRALAFTLEAMAEAYAWVVCRLHQGPDTADLLALVSAASDSVVIASDADAGDPKLSDLYAIAMDAGAGQVLIAQDRPAEATDGHAADIHLAA